MERLTRDVDPCILICRMENKSECAYFTGHCKLKCREARIYEKLVGLEKAEAEGMLVRLPCAPDKHCYAVTPLNCEFMNCPKQDENGGCDNNCPDVIVDIIPEMIPFGDLVGVRLFATHEEASAAPRGYTLESGGTA